MAIKLEKETEKHLIGSIKRFFAEDMDDEIIVRQATPASLQSKAPPGG